MDSIPKRQYIELSTFFRFTGALSGGKIIMLISPEIMLLLTTNVQYGFLKVEIRKVKINAARQ
jgi:hypothetical protein